MRHRAVCWLLALYVLSASLAQAQPEVLWRRASPSRGLSVSFSADGRWLALSRVWGSVLVYRMPERELVRAFHGDSAVFLGSRLLAISSGDTVTIRHVPSFRPVRQLPTGGWLLASRDGKVLLVVRQPTPGPPTVELWTGAPLQRRMVFAGAGMPSLSADGRFLAYAQPYSSGQKRIVVRRTRDGLVARQFTLDRVDAHALSADGSHIAVVRLHEVDVYRMADGRLERTLRSAGRWPLYTLRFSDDGQYLAGGYGPDYETGVWQLWRVSDGALLSGQELVYPDEAWTLEFSPDSQQLYVVHQRWIRVVHTSNLQEEEWREPEPFSFLGFLDGGAQVAITDRKAVRFLNSANGMVQREVSLPEEMWGYLHVHLSAAVSADGRVFATYPYQNGVGVFDLPDNGGAVLRYTIPLGQLTVIGEPMQMKWNRDGSRLYILDFDYLLHIVNGADGSVMESLRVDYGFDISPDGDYIAYDSGTELVVRRLQNGALVTLYTLPVTVRSLQIVQNGSALAVLEENRVALYDLPTGRLTRFLPVSSPSLRRAVFSEDGQLIALYYGDDWSGDTRVDVVSWDGNNVDSWRQPDIPRWVAFSPDSRYLAVERHGLEMLRGYSSLSSQLFTIVLPGWMGLAPEHLRYTWRRISTGEVLDKGSARITSGEAPVYRFRVPHPDPFSADLSLTVEGPPFLRGRVGLSGFTVGYLFTGDIDGDGEVTLFDFGRLVAAFGSIAGDERYDIDADLDGDGEVGLFDFAWLVTHFGMTAEE